MADLLETGVLKGQWGNSLEPLRIFRWLVGIDGIDAFTAKTFARPTRTFDEIRIDYINTVHWFSGKPVWNDITLVLYDPIAPSSAAKILDWVKINYDETTGQAGYAYNYKRDITLKMLDPVGAVAQKWTIGGAWPRDINFNELDYNSAEPATCSMVLRYDSASLDAAVV